MFQWLSFVGEQPFMCNVCGKRFSRKGNMTVHLRLHGEHIPHCYSFHVKIFLKSAEYFVN